MGVMLYVSCVLEFYLSYNFRIAGSFVFVLIFVVHFIVHFPVHFIVQFANKSLKICGGARIYQRGEWLRGQRRRGVRGRVPATLPGDVPGKEMRRVSVSVPS